MGRGWGKIDHQYSLSHLANGIAARCRFLQTKDQIPYYVPTRDAGLPDQSSAGLVMQVASEPCIPLALVSSEELKTWGFPQQ